MTTITQIEMPRYKSLKTMWALRIKFINPGNDNIVFEDERFSPVKVGKDYFAKHQPHVGGFFVIYKDGSQSFMPADEMDEDYALIEN